MRLAALLLLALPLAGACTGQPWLPGDGASPPAAAGAPIFREISIAPHGTIALAAPFEQRATSARVLSVGMYLLVGDGTASYGGTDSLLVEVDRDDIVRALHFVYPAAFDFDASVAEYTATLGAPRDRTVVDSAGGRLERLAWSDARTRFTLSRWVRGGQPARTRSVLRSATDAH